jgi:uncharacterized protein (TIGR00255 family)
MLRSMTGFGASSSAGALRVEVRSVNHRHLSVKVRLAEAHAALEPEVEARVRARCERGAVTVNLIAEPGAGAGRARVDVALARQYREELARLADELGLGAHVSLDLLASLPGVLVPASGGPGDADGALALVDEALERMLEMRAAEGRALGADLQRNARALARLAARIGRRMPRVVRAQAKALTQRVGELLGARAALAPADLAREVALLADKLDVSEELARLASHLGQFEELLERGGRVGRQLDFLTQEVFRELNTIGSKCSDATVVQWVVEAKVLVERLREQVQNVE